MSALHADLSPIADVGLATLHHAVGGAVNIAGMADDVVFVVCADLSWRQYQLSGMISSGR